MKISGETEAGPAGEQPAEGYPDAGGIYAPWRKQRIYLAVSSALT